jgi:hypothetical protein
MARDEAYDFLVGIDWTTESHAVCNVDRDHQVVVELNVTAQRTDCRERPTPNPSRAPSPSGRHRLPMALTMEDVDDGLVQGSTDEPIAPAPGS